MFKVLVAEDEEITLNHIGYVLGREGYQVTAVGNGSDALKKLEGESFDLLIADVKMPGLTGMELLDAITARGVEIEVIIITAYGSIESAVEAMRKGAYDYITKPLELDELLMKILKIQSHKSLKKENAALRASLAPQKEFRLVAESNGSRKILDMAHTIKDSACSVLLTGESGVGKSVIAREIHRTSHRADKPFLSVNCANFTSELLSSELFGHEAGAFTGALKTKKGLAEVADSGTLFLDEIAELSPNLQAMLLKFLEEGEFYRVGGTRLFKVDVRVMAATNRNIPELLADGRFRKDLYFRLNVMEISIPPLRARREDVRPLALHFLAKHLPRYSKKISGFSHEAMGVLINYDYPGNIRELENIVERAVILEREDVITTDNLPQSVLSARPGPAINDGGDGIDVIKGVMTIEELSRDYALKVLNSAGGNRTKAAEMLGISRTSLWKILKEEGEGSA
jgi:DNA-binding NtrC family response regulator